MPQATLKQLLNRRPDSHKYDYGHVLVWGGSPGMIGAPMLSALAALRTGAGLVTIASSPEVIDKLEGKVLEVMTLRASSPRDIEEYIKARKVSVLAVGPGMQPDQAETVRQIIKNSDLPIVVDGGGLAAFNENFSLLSEKIILTPHAGEFQKLFNEKLATDRQKLKQVAQKFASDHEAHLVLKGQPTFVAHPDEQVYQNTTGNPGLATAGTGDVLTGIIAGIIAQKVELSNAVEAAVYLHGLAGDLAAQNKTQPGMIASDVIKNISAALKHFN